MPRRRSHSGPGWRAAAALLGAAAVAALSAGPQDGAAAVAPRPRGATARGAHGAGRPARIAAVGDLLLAGSMLARIRREGDAYPFRETADTLSAADVAFANLEVPLTTVDAPTPGKDPESVRAGRDYVFRAPPRLATAIRDAGFDVVSLANNHAMDQGALGLAETTEALRKAGIEYVGAGRDELEAARPALTRTGGVTIAWLAASEVLPLSSVASAERAGIAASRGTHGGRDARAALLRRVRTLKAQGLVVIVSLHWGAEGQIAPTDAQRRLARALSSAGADALVGHHPHVLQGFAWMDRTFVAYSLGNFVASPRGRLARESAILELQIDELGVREARVRPVWIEDGQARLLSGAAAERQMSQIASISSLVGGVVRATGEVHAEQPARGRSQ